MSVGIIININIINNIDITTNNILIFLKEFLDETGYKTDSVYFGTIEMKR